LSLKTKVDVLSVVWPQNHWDGLSSVWASKSMVTVCEWFVLKTTRTIFTGLPSKPAVSGGLSYKPTATVFSNLASKLVVTVFSSLASKLVATVSPGLASKPAISFLVEPQNQQLRFGDLGLKITATISWFGPQNQVGFGLSVAP
jgi:hypothetical protein